MKYLYTLAVILLANAVSYAQNDPASIEYSFSLDHSYPLGTFARSADYGSGATFSIRAVNSTPLSFTSSVSYHHWDGLPQGTEGSATLRSEYHSVRLVTGATYRLGAAYVGGEAGFLDMSASSGNGSAEAIAATSARTHTAWGFAPVVGLRAHYEGIWVDVAARYSHFGAYRFGEVRVGLLISAG